MGLYNDKKDYEEIVKENIKKANLLYPLSPEDRILVEKLLNKKEDIINKNGFFASIQLSLINRKIRKIQTKSKNR